MSSEIVGRRETTHQRVLRDTIAEWGYPRGTYAVFLGTGEGEILPIGTEEDPVEEYSGYLVARDGKHLFFWMAWDAEKGKPAMIHRDLFEPDTSLFEDDEYREARRRWTSGGSIMRREAPPARQRGVVGGSLFEGMMNPLRDRIVARLDTLPEVQLREVLNFIDFLTLRAADQGESLLTIAGSLTGESLSGKEIERELYEQ